MNFTEGLFSLGFNQTFNISSEGRPTLPTLTENVSQSLVWSGIAVDGEDQSRPINFPNILTEEMKTISLPCLLVSIPIIILCMLVCELLYKTVMNNVVPGLFRHCQSQ